MNERQFGVGVVLLAIVSACLLYRMTTTADARNAAKLAKATPPPPGCTCYCSAPTLEGDPHVP